jgi:hypothetical protein
LAGFLAAAFFVAMVCLTSFRSRWVVPVELGVMPAYFFFLAGFLAAAFFVAMVCLTSFLRS